MRPHTKGSRACRLCREQKRRCNGEEPCQLCIKRGSECIFEPWTGHGGPNQTLSPSSSNNLQQQQQLQQSPTQQIQQYQQQQVVVPTTSQQQQTPIQQNSTFVSQHGRNVSEPGVSSNGNQYDFASMSNTQNAQTLSNVGPIRTPKMNSQMRTNPLANGAPTPPDIHSLSRPPPPTLPTNSSHQVESTTPKQRHNLPSWHSRSSFNNNNNNNNNNNSTPLGGPSSGSYAAQSPRELALQGAVSSGAGGGGVNGGTGSSTSIGVQPLPPPFHNHPQHPSTLPQSNYHNNHYHHHQHHPSHHYSQSGRTPGGSSSAHTDSPDNRAANVQSNSGVLFAASIAADLGAKHIIGRDEGPFIAWNLGLRNACSTSKAYPQPWSQLIHRRTMMIYLETYENVMHPIYRFVQIDKIVQLVESHHGQEQRHGTILDAIICGIAAIGSVFSDTKDIALETALEQNARAILDAHAEDENHLPETAGAWLLRTLYLRASKVPHACWHASCIVMHACERSRIHIEDSASSLRSAGIAPMFDLRRTYHVAKLLNAWISWELGRTSVTLARASTLLPDMSCVGTETSATMLHLFDLSLILEPSGTPTQEQLLQILHEVAEVPCPSPVVVLSQAMVILSIVRRLRFGLGLQLSTDTTMILLTIGQKSMDCVNEILKSGLGPWWHVATLPYQVLCTVMALNTRKALTLVPNVLDTIRHAHSRYQTQMMDRILKRSLALVKALHKHKLDDARLLNKALGRGGQNENGVIMTGEPSTAIQAGLTGKSPSSQMTARTPPMTGNVGRSNSESELPPHLARQIGNRNGSNGGAINDRPVGGGMIWDGKKVDLESWLDNIDWDSIMQSTEPTFFDATGAL